MKSRRRTMQYAHHLSEQELLQRGHDIALAHAEMAKHAEDGDAVKKELKKRESDIQKRIDELAMQLRTRTEMRTRTVIVELDFRNGLARETDETTGEPLQTRALTAEEQQMPLIDD